MGADLPAPHGSVRALLPDRSRALRRRGGMWRRKGCHPADPPSVGEGSVPRDGHHPTEHRMVSAERHCEVSELHLRVRGRAQPHPQPARPPVRAGRSFRRPGCLRGPGAPPVRVHAHVQARHRALPAGVRAHPETGGQGLRLPVRAGRGDRRAHPFLRRALPLRARPRARQLDQRPDVSGELGGYSLDALGEMLRESGMAWAEPLHRGSWCGRNSNDAQDVAIWTRSPGS